VGEHREGGAGPAEGITLMMNGRSATVPTSCDFVSTSPYIIQSVNGIHTLYKNASPLSEVDIPDPPQFYHLTTRDGIPYHKIALLHGSNCLASTVSQKCIYWNSNKRCTFCGIELSLKSKATILKKSPQQLLEVVKAASELDGVQHITLTTGAHERSSDEIDDLSSCCSCIKSGSTLPIHVQLMPPTDLKLLEQLKKSGANTVGIHIESFDFDVLKRAAPIKAEKTLTYYMKTWKEAINIFGFNQVSSFIIVGLGERKESVIEGAALLCELGVYPFIVPLRPIPGTPLATHQPPPPDDMISIYQQTSTLLKRHGLSWRNSKAGCVRCGACSALPDFEDGY
jgi:radical SAM protein (TIGR04043 family)